MNNVIRPKRYILVVNCKLETNRCIALPKMFNYRYNVQ